MPWCPKCKTEYREGFNVCSDCNIELVPELPQEPDENANVVNDKETFLISVANDMEAKVIEELLSSHNIPVLRKYKGAGGYLQIYMGVTIFGIDLFVSSRELETAKEILAAEYRPLIEYDKDSIEEEIRNNSTSESGKKRRIKIWILALIFMPGLLWLVISAILSFFK